MRGESAPRVSQEVKDESVSLRLLCSCSYRRGRGLRGPAARPPRRRAARSRRSSDTCTSTTTPRRSTRVAGFDRHADGSLTPIAGLPVRGRRLRHRSRRRVAGLAAAERRRPLSARRRRRQQPDLGAADQARRLAAGRQGSPVASGGVDPVSIARPPRSRLRRERRPGRQPRRHELHRLQAQRGRPPQADSELDRTCCRTTPSPARSSSTATGRRLAGTRIATSEIDSFTVGARRTADRRLPARRTTPRRSRRRRAGASSAASSARPTRTSCSSPTPTPQPEAQPSRASSPASPTRPTASLTPVGAPVANDGGASCWVEISHDGSFLFVVNTGSATVSSYSIGTGGALTFLQSTAPGEIGAGAEDARLSPDGSTLWVVESGTDAVTGFTVNGGTLTPLAAAAGPRGSDALRHRRQLTHTAPRRGECPASALRWALWRGVRAVEGARLEIA